MFKQLYSLLEKRERWQLLGVGLCMAGMAFLQALGVASILPFMQVLAKPDIVDRNRWLRTMFMKGDFQSVESFLFFLGIAVLVMICMSNGVGALTTWVMYRFAWGENHRLSTRLLGKYLNRPYTFFLTRNTADLNKNILSEVQTVVHGVLLATLKLVSSCLIAVFIIALLALIDWKLALLVGLLLGGTYGIVYVSLRRRQRQLGRERLAYNEKRFKIAGEALTGIKELKILGREREFLKRFRVPSWRFSRATASNNVNAQIPRYALEAIAFSGVLLLVLYLLRTTGEVGEIVPMMSLYVFAGYRLLPSLNEIFTAAIQIRFNRAALDALHDDLHDERPTSSPSTIRLDGSENLTLHDRITVRDLSFTYPDSAVASLDNVSLVIERHDVVGIVGETGAGKTTLVDLILGLLEPSSGTIEIDGIPLTSERQRNWRRSCGYIPQEIFLIDDSIRANIALGIPTESIDEGSLIRAAECAQIHGFISSLPLGYDTEVGERGVRLSGGQRQRIGIARALYHDPQLLVLDEATSSLDGATEAAVMDMIHNLGRRKTIIVIAHRLSTVRACDVVFVLGRGKLIGRGTLEDLAARHQEFRSMAGILTSAAADR